MTYNDFLGMVGSKFDIVNGELTYNPAGTFTVSETYQPFSIYLNKKIQKYMIIAPESSYIGQEYRLKYRDCITLFTKWLDDHVGSSYGNIYQKISHDKFKNYYDNGMSLWYEDNGFQKVTDYQEGDCLVYAYKPSVLSHVGIYLNGNKILHHMPFKLSCIDDIDETKIVGAYRYAK